LKLASFVDKANQQKGFHSQTYKSALFFFDTALKLNDIKKISSKS